MYAIRSYYVTVAWVADHMQHLCIGIRFENLVGIPFDHTGLVTPAWFAFTFCVVLLEQSEQARISRNNFV